MTDDSTLRWQPPVWLTAALIAFGAMLRWMAVTHQEAISVDSVRYLQFAEGWTTGRYFTLGPTGLKEFPDLGYPLLVSFFLPGSEDPIRTAQLVSWGMGVLTLVLIARIAHRLYGPLVGFFTVLLAAVCQPLLVASGQVLTESTFIALSLLALDATLACSERPSVGQGILLGFACAMGYLTRGIGLLLFPLALVLLWWLARQPDNGPTLSEETLADPVRQTQAVHSHQLSLMGGWAPALVAILLTWLAVVAPYWAMLSATYGHFVISDQAIWHVSGLSGTLQPKTDDIRLEGTLNQDGTDYALNDWFHAGRPGAGGPALGPLVRRYAQNLVALWYYIPEELLDPLTLMLCTLGLFGNAGVPRRQRAALILLWWMVPYLVFQPLFLTLGRYLLPVVPLVLIFAGRGLLTLQEWAAGRALLRQPKLTGADLAFLERVVFIVVFLLYTPGMIWPVTHVSPRYQNLEARAAGLWLRAQQPSGGVFASSPVAGFYAGVSPNLVLPDADLEQILRLAQRKEVRYLLLEERRLPTSRPASLTALLYAPKEQLPSGVRWLHDVTTWPGYRVRILEIQHQGLAQGGR